MKPSVLFVVGAFAVLPAALPARAEIFRWVDRDGVVHFQDTPPPAGVPATIVPGVPAGAAPEGVEGGVGEPGGGAPAPDNAVPAAPVAPATRTPVKLKQNPKVEIYGTSWCPYCKQAQEYFRARGIAFDFYDVERDRDAMRRKKELDPDGGVPTTVIDGKVIRGFYADQYEKALEAPN